MPNLPWPMIFRLLALIFLLILAWWGFLFSFQRQILFPIPELMREGKPPGDATVIWLQGALGETEAWYLPPTGNLVNSKAPLLIFAHGNATLMDEISDDFDPPRRWGMGVLLVEYPGYARSKGKPSQDSITKTMLAAYDWAASQSFIDSHRIIGHGRSIGGGAVCELAKNRNVAAMILESAFTSTRPFASRFGAPGFLILDPFDNLEVISQFEKPLILFHGDKDNVVPIEHGKTLAKAAGIPLEVRDGGHNDLPRPWKEIKKFLLENRLIDQEKKGN